jgi:DNA-binding CsgD family transcriptional regulator
MLSIFQTVIGMTDVDAICEVPLGALELAPIHIHCKDLTGKYMSSNARVWRDAGLNGRSDLLGRTDLDMDFLSENEAASFRALDKFVITSKQTHFFSQTVTLANNKKHIALNHKTPLYSQSNKVAGVISFGVVIEQAESSFFDSSYPMLNLIFSSRVDLIQLLSARQLSCLYYLVAGFSYKEIAIKLRLSPRTVENYIDAIKTKLDCPTRSNLISFVLAT